MGTLELHRRRFIADGGRGGLLRMDDLEPDERRVVSDEVFAEIRRTDAHGDAIYTAYVAVLSRWGIVCPHPQTRRRYGGTHVSEVPVVDDEWFLCLACGTSVVNEDWRTAHPDEVVTRSAYLRLRRDVVACPCPRAPATPDGRAA